MEHVVEIARTPISVTNLDMHMPNFSVRRPSPHQNDKYEISGAGEIWLKVGNGGAHVRFTLTKQMLRRDITFVAEDGKLFSSTFAALPQEGRKELAVAIKTAIRARINQHIEAMLGLMKQPE